MPVVTYLECWRCGQKVSAESLQTVCPVDGGALYVRYDMERVKRTVRREDIVARAAGSPASLGMWRYASVLPEVEPVTLGEGWTPMLPSRRYPGLLVKEEGANPTGTYKARGVSLALAMAKQAGQVHVATAFDGGSPVTVAAYSAAAGVRAHVFLPQDVPYSTHVALVLYGADITLVDGAATECARRLDERVAAQRGSGEAWLALPEMHGPFEMEGAKTLGYEVVEQLGWVYPDAVLCSVEGCAVLSGMWKAFEEMERLGWVRGKRPKMYGVGGEFSTAASTRVSLDDSMAQRLVRESEGKLVAVTDEEILQSRLQWARQEGILLSREGGAAAAGYERLLAEGELKGEERVVFFNTAAGSKDAEVTGRAMRVRLPARLPESMPVGGIITPV